VLIPGILFPHEATVQAPAGEGAYGPVQADPVTISCLWEDKRRMVRTAEGREVLSSATVIAPPGTDIPAGSLLTRGGRTATVMHVATHDAGGLPTPNHVEVFLQ
jgi:hypothetical protein